LLGALDELELESGEVFGKADLRGCYLGWVHARKELIVVHKRIRDVPAASLSANTRKKHSTFHDAAPSRATQFDWDPKPANTRDLGRIRALTYSIPKALRSPEKAKFRWHHAFGDHGEHGHGPTSGKKKSYPAHFMPGLSEDSRGNLYIVRKPGNKFDVRDWIWW